MNQYRLQELIEAYGADPARWPADERDAARALLAQSPDALAAQARARRLDEALDGVSPTAVAAAGDRILRSLDRLPRQIPATPALIAGALPRAAMLAAASVAGIIIGLGGVDGRMPAPTEADVVTLVGEPDIISFLE